MQPPSPVLPLEVRRAAWANLWQRLLTPEPPKPPDDPPKDTTAEVETAAEDGGRHDGRHPTLSRPV